MCGGGGLADLIWLRARLVRAGVDDGSVASLANAHKGGWSGGAVVLCLQLVWFPFVIGWGSVCVEAGDGDSYRELVFSVGVS